ncbi:hypothetical protein [Paenibacillus aceti]|uniref:Uncharacterized protein n=1 Tax=Paenibacillus aceti TaxID=1820010 RepID=A0ABQ1VRC7_9BACL|nr:hypothetical protein [Paenibacillus aceti]GGF86529.1 hypothetical protein GCM10010913_05030 [Paenibacillus aceti]
MKHDDYELFDQDFDLFIRKGLESFGLDPEGKVIENENIDR